MEKLRTTTNIVKYILETDEKARNNDGHLYYKVLDVCGQRDDVSYVHMTIRDLLPHIKALGVPNFETVRRARQKIQHENPDLSACKKVAEYRSENEQKFRVYARGEFKC